MTYHLAKSHRLSCALVEDHATIPLESICCNVWKSHVLSHQ